MSASDNLSWGQFRNIIIPGEYHTAWASIPKHPDFKKGQSLGELTDQVRAEGIQKPVTVFRDDSPSKAVLVDGHHRVLAAKAAGVSIPVEYTDDEQYADQAEVARRTRLKGNRRIN